MVSAQCCSLCRLSSVRVGKISDAAHTRRTNRSPLGANAFVMQASKGATTCRGEACNDMQRGHATTRGMGGGCDDDT